MITDPALACHVLNSPAFDKFPFLYNYLGPVRSLLVCMPTSPVLSELGGTRLTQGVAIIKKILKLFGIASWNK